ncbi:MAG: TerD family protein [Pseudopedobacter sp.]|nr:TerD family protein [Deinococcales bacterium]
MTPFMRGQKTKLADLTPSLSLTVTLNARGSAPEYDLSCFGLDAQGKLSDDRYMIFFNQKASPEGAVRLEGQGGQGSSSTFQIDLSRLPAPLERLVFTVTVDAPHTLATLNDATLTLSSAHPSTAGQILASFQAHSYVQKERALMVAELYKKGEWRFAAVGQGFEGGLSDLLKHFGGQVKRESLPSSPPPTPVPTPVPPRAPQPTPVPATPPAPRISLGKVTLEKSGDHARIDLRKGQVHRLHVNLNWDRPRPGFLGMMRAGADLDLGCLFELEDGSAGVIQALGNAFGSSSSAPYIHLDQDDRSGAATGGENLYLERPDLIKRVLVFAYIYGGSARGFRDVNARLTLKDPQGNEILVALNNPSPNLTCCGVALLEPRDGQLQISKEERYFANQEPMSNHYRFPLKWTPGRKD